MICSRRCPGATSHGARYAAEALGAVRSPCSPTPAGVDAACAADVGVPVLVHPAPRSVLGELAATVYGRPSDAAAVIGVTGTSGKTTTTYLVEAGLRAAGRVGRADRDRRHPDRRARRAQRADHPGGAGAAGAVRGDGRARRRHRGDGGVQPRADPRPRRRDALRGRRIHQPVPGPPGLPPDHGRLLRGQGPAVRPGIVQRAQALSVVCIDDDAGRAMARPRAPPGRRSADRPARTRTGGSRMFAPSSGAARSSSPSTPPACTTGYGSGCPAATTSPTPCSRWPCSTRWTCPPSRPHPGCATASVPGRLESSRPGPGISGAGRLRPQAGRVARRCSRPCVSRPARAGWRWWSAPAATAIRASASRWARSRPNWPTWWSSPTTTRATRIRRRSGRRLLAGAKAAGGPAQVVEIGDRREAIDDAVGWARPGDVVLIAGKGHETGQTAATGGRTRSTTATSWPRRSRPWGIARDRSDHRADRRHRRRRARRHLAAAGRHHQGHRHRRVRLADGDTGRTVPRAARRPRGRARLRARGDRAPARSRCSPRARSACRPSS